MQAQVQRADGLIVAIGDFPGGTADPDAIDIREVLSSEEPKLAEPGQKHMDAAGIITVTPPPPPPYTFAAAEDTERLRLVNERARTDPAYAALADFVLKGVAR